MAKTLIITGIVVALISRSSEGRCDDYKDCGSCTSASEELEVCCWNAVNSICSSSHIGICHLGGTRLSYNCPNSLPKNFVYTDEFGRSKALPFLAAAYGNNTSESQQCLSNAIPGARMWKHYKTDPCDNGTCVAILAYSMADRAIVVSFRGAKGEDQMLKAATDLYTDVKLPFPTEGNVYQFYRMGFYTFWNQAGLKKDLETLKGLFPDYEFWAFGHSLGSGMASLIGSYLVQAGYFPSEKVKVITTGQSRVGDLNYAQAHDRLVPHTFRLINKDDPVTKMPPKSFADLEDSYHHRFEVWYPNGMAKNASFVICNQAETSSCSASTNETESSLFSHNSYFNLEIDTWINTGCK